ncbi:MAG: ABC transporter transmembrane domain-containing protein, partial [Chlamydiota bacterium]|nr:ABC transporter transmembrane domain-containing protein [Chlamydiota bacterium]
MIYRRLLDFVKIYWLRLLIAFICMLVFSVFNTAIAWVFRYVFKEAFLHPSGTTLLIVPSLIMVTFLCRGLADFGQSYYMNWVGLKVVSDVRNALYEKLHQLSLDYFLRTKSGMLISRITYDVTLIQNAISVALSDLIKEPLCLIGLIITLFYFDPVLASISIIVFPLIIIPVIRFGKRVRKASIRAQKDIGNLTSLVQEVLGGIRIVKAFTMESYEIGRFKLENRRFFKSMMEGVRASQLNRPVIEIFGACGVGLAFWYGAQHLSLDTFLSFITALFLCYEPIKKLSKVNNIIQQASASGERIFEILDIEPSIQEVSNPLRSCKVETGIVFQDLWFRYDEQWVLKGINFAMPSNQITALVGPSGTGKTTIANLIPRFYDPQRGSVMLDGIRLDQYAVEALRSEIGIVTQDVFLFNDTIRQNLAYGRTDVSEDVIVAAAKVAHAHEFIECLPNKYDSVIGERGLKLSGGQCQRLAIARALVKNPKILIFDEATSALDSESERFVQEAMTTLMEGRTVLVIAHRLSTVKRADQILVLDSGTIVERGKHEELLSAGGIYKKLY